jgi:hypothetical protein
MKINMPGHHCTLELLIEKYKRRIQMFLYELIYSADRSLVLLYYCRPFALKVNILIVVSYIFIGHGTKI